MEVSEEYVPREWDDASEVSFEKSKLMIQVLFHEPKTNADSVKVQFIPTPRKSHKNCTKVKNKSGLSIFKTIIVCTETVDAANITDEKDLEPSLRR
jgi:hypothetical protein